MACLAFLRNFRHAGNGDREVPAMRGSASCAPIFGLFSIVFGVVVLIAGAAYLFRASLLELILAETLKGNGYQEVSADVSKFDLGGRVEGAMRARHGASGQALAIEKAAVDFDLKELILDRRVKRVAIGPGQVVGSVSDSGDIAIAGISLNGDGSGGGAVPLEELVIDDLSFVLVTPGGDVTGATSGAVELKEGGQFEIIASTAAAGTKDVGVANATAEAAFSFDQSGDLSLNGSFEGDVLSPVANGADIAVSIDGKGNSWRALMDPEAAQFNGIVDLALQSANVEATALGESSNLLFDIVRSFSASGDLAVEITPDGLVVKEGERPITLVNPRGDALSVTAGESGIVFNDKNGSREVDVRMALSGNAAGEFALTAMSTDETRWAYNATGKFDRQLFGRTIIRDANFNVSGDSNGTVFSGIVGGEATVSRAAIGRLRVKDAPLKADFDYVLDLPRQILTVAADGEGCASLKGAGLRVLEQDMEASLRNAKLCASDGPLVTVNWNGAPGAEARARLFADWSRYRLGETVFEGAPPRIDFDAVYTPETETTVISGTVMGGSIVMNGGLRGTHSDGIFNARLEGEKLTGDAKLTKAVISESRDVKTLQPFLVSGAATLEDDVVNFTAVLETRKGDKFAEGSGAHNVLTSTGESIFIADAILFEPDGLQPTDIADILEGVVADASGIAGGEVISKWADGKLTSTGAFEFLDLKFQGPGRAVSETAGVNGAINFTNLSPVATDGEQVITIDRVDLDALILEDGEIRFEMPGDETVRIISAVFPWFGGEIGAYNTDVAMVSGETNTVLRASNVSLGDLLAQLQFDGLSGEGTVEGELPIMIENGRAVIKNGRLSAVGPGVIRYVAAATDAVASSNEQVGVAFDGLRELKFTELTTTIDGPLDGSLKFGILIEGQSAITLSDPRIREKVQAPVIYRINLDAPLLALIEQARLTFDVELQRERAGLIEAEE